MIPTFRNIRERIKLNLYPYGSVNENKTIEEECENEEEMVELCARDFLIYTNETMAETETEMDTFCRLLIN